MSETKSLTTPSGVAVEIKTALSAGDFIDANDAPNGVELSKIQLSKKLMDVADRCADGRLVSLLEGGYDLQALGNSVAAHVTALMRG